MKNLLTAILILSTLIALFSFYGENVPLEHPYGNWGISGGNSGDPVPAKGDGEDGIVDTVTLAEATAEPQETVAQQEAPITVSIKQKPVWEYVLYGVGITLSVEVVGLLVLAVVLLRKEKKYYGCVVCER